MAEPFENVIKSPEFAPRPETGKEKAREEERPRESFVVEEKISEAVAPTPVVQAAPAASAPSDPTATAIETVLSEDLYEHFRAMPPDVQAKFRAKGEETVSKLSVMVEGTVIKAKAVLLIIVSWLKIIPGVSKYFLEQESKIKTDKILELHRRKHGQ